jgi:hypothetical protein
MVSLKSVRRLAVYSKKGKFSDVTALVMLQSLFGWAGPEILVQPRKYSCFSTAESGGSYASANDHRLAKVM